MAEVKLYLDENVEPILAHVLRSKGFDVISAHEVDLLGKSDEEQLEFAISQQRAILTFDSKDFAPLTDKFFKEGKEHFGIILSAQNSQFLSKNLSGYPQNFFNN